MTKTWGFGIPCGPLQFSTIGWRESARKILVQGDLVVIVGTKGPETDDEEQGRILGLMEPTSEIVNSSDYKLPGGPQSLNFAGTYKWPYALKLSRAWRFDNPRWLLSEISARQFQMDSAQGIVLLNSDEAAAIVALPRTEVELMQGAASKAAIEHAIGAQRKAAPTPTTERTGIMHMRRMPAFTYAMEIRGATQPAVKVGWAFDWARRQRAFNHASMPALGGLRYVTKLKQRFPTATEAFRMEQWLLKRFDPRRSVNNIEILAPMTLSDLQIAWIDYISGRAR